MQKHLIITGEAGIGKTGAILKVLGDRLSYAGGFAAMPAPGGNGISLYPASALCGVNEVPEGRFLWFSDSGICKDNEVFRNNGVRLLAEAQEYPYAVLEPFGGFELVIPQFREALYDFFRSDVPVLAVMLDDAAVENKRGIFGLGDRLLSHRRDLLSFLENDSGTMVFCAGEDDMPRLESIIALWADTYL